MKKNLWIWAIAALSMAACTSEDTPAPQVTDNDWISPDGRVVVQLGAESTASVSVSRAPIEGTNITVLKDLGIFALDRDATFDNNILTNWVNNNDCLLMNVKAEGADAGGNTPIDPLDPAVNTGKKISLYKSDGTGSAGAVYYYPMQGAYKYDFYGYQPREGSTVSVSQGKMQVTMTLDGAKDLITGIHNAQDAQYKGIATPVSETDLYDTEATDTEGPKKPATGETLQGFNAKYIRTIKYHNWIIDEYTDADLSAEKKPFVPKLEFVHRLTKLNFQIITAKKQSGPEDGTTGDQGDDRNEAAQLCVKEVKLVNVPTNATLTLEPAMTLTFAGSESLNMQVLENAAVWDNGKIIPQVYTENGSYESAGYLMVPATADITTAYQISLVVIAKNESGEPTEQTVTLDLKDSENNPITFLAGMSYNIQIALYAQQEVQVSATLTDWVPGSDVYVPVE